MDRQKNASRVWLCSTDCVSRRVSTVGISAKPVAVAITLHCTSHTDGPKEPAKDDNCDRFQAESCLRTGFYGAGRY